MSDSTHNSVEAAETARKYWMNLHNLRQEGMVKFVLDGPNNSGPSNDETWTTVITVTYVKPTTNLLQSAVNVGTKFYSAQGKKKHLSKELVSKMVLLALGVGEEDLK